MAGLVFLSVLVISFRVVDLSHLLHEKIPIWPGGVPFSREILADWDKDGYRMFKFIMGENVGTHVDAPSHFVKGAPNIDDIKNIFLPAIKIDIEGKVEKDPTAALTPDDIKAWEKKNGRIPPGSLVIINTGWWRKWGRPAEYVNMKEGVMRFPGISPEGARELVKRKIAAIGIDTLSLDPGPSKDFSAHKILFKAGIWGIENLTNLDKLPPKGFHVFVGMINIKDGTQTPARVIAVLGDVK